MNQLSSSKRAAVLQCLMEGNSVASTTRITGAAKATILSLQSAAGEACSDYHDRHMRNLPCRVLQLDEVWSFVGCKEKTKKIAKLQHPGDVWTWTAICADTKLIPSWRIGDRSNRTAYAFCGDLAERFTGRLQITTDGHQAYQWAVGSSFIDCDYAMLVKIYGQDENGEEICMGARKQPMLGNPDLDLVSTSYVERSNLSIRMTNRRFTRKTNAYSKKLENHCHMMALTLMSYNFCRRHSTIKETPAMAAGVADHKWSLSEVVDMIDAYTRQKDEADFAAAFEDKLTRPRTRPKTFPPTPKHLIPLPWYLDPNSDGPPEKGSV